MNQNLFALIAFLISTVVYSQKSDSTKYDYLPVVKYYLVDLDSEITNGKGKYFINGSKASKAKYEKMEAMLKAKTECCPCIKAGYDTTGKLVREYVGCGECVVGWHKEYYPNGILKLYMSYKDIKRSEWSNVFNLGICGTPHGRWTYYNETGDTMYSEYWDNGTFIKQVPEQEAAEIWDLSIKYKDQKLDTQSMFLNEVKNISFVPKFKNSNTKFDLKIKYTLMAIGHKPIEATVPIIEFKNIDFEELLSDNNIPTEVKHYVLLSIIINDKSYGSVSVNIKKK